MRNISVVIVEKVVQTPLFGLYLKEINFAKNGSGLLIRSIQHIPIPTLLALGSTVCSLDQQWTHTHTDI